MDRFHITLALPCRNRYSYTRGRPCGKGIPLAGHGVPAAKTRDRAGSLLKNESFAQIRRR